MRLLKEQRFPEELLRRFVEMSKAVFGERLTGIYLHGSAAMGCFNPEKSDVDLLLVVNDEIPDNIKREFMENVVRLNGEAPPKGIELSVVKREFCRPFVYPTPYELHFSVIHEPWFREAPEDYVARMKGTDADLAAHVTIVREYGIVLFGEEIREVFGSVPPKAYADSIRLDVENARTDILTNPVYVTLNLCRVLAYLREGLILSKKSGGEWGLRSLPQEFQGLIGAALKSYETDAEMEADAETARRFADAMLSEIGNIWGGIR